MLTITRMKAFALFIWFCAFGLNVLCCSVGGDVEMASSFAEQLVWAIEDGDFDNALSLIPVVLENEVQDIEGLTALHYAVFYNRPAIVLCLLRAGSNINACDPNQLTPLHYAASLGRLEVMTILVGHELANVDAEDSNRSTPLHHAINHSYTRTIRAILENRNDEEFLQEEHLHIIGLLLAKGANVNAQDNDGNGPLHMAIIWGHPSVLQILLYYQPEINLKNMRGRTPLHQAAIFNEIDSVHMLIVHGAEVNETDNAGLTPFFLALRKGYAEVSKMLLAPGCSIDGLDEHQKTPLHYAAEKGLWEIIRMLLKRPDLGPIDPKDIYDRTPLYYASRNGHKATVCLLLVRGADPNQQVPASLLAYVSKAIGFHGKLPEMNA